MERYRCRVRPAQCCHSFGYPTVWTDCDSTKEWFMAQWHALAIADQLVGLPAMYRNGVSWSLELRKEDNALRGSLREDGASTPEDDGKPCFLLYGPRAFIKLRCESADVADRATSDKCLFIIYLFHSLDVQRPDKCTQDQLNCIYCHGTHSSEISSVLCASFFCSFLSSSDQETPLRYMAGRPTN
jgi:hypothetical protein